VSRASVWTIVKSFSTIVRSFSTIARSLPAIISSLVRIMFWKYSIAFSMPSFEAIIRALSGSKTSILSDLGDISTTFLISKRRNY
jgi:hypothetical protein